jgi:arylsulfate sulfotransferase
MELARCRVCLVVSLAFSLISAGCGGKKTSSASSPVAATKNPLVAKYTVQPPVGSSVFVEFGTDTQYGRKTSKIPAAADGGPVAIFVAGMRANTTYHMRAVTEMSDGSTAADSDQTFQTSDFKTSILPKIEITKPPGMTPQPGIELLDSTNSSAVGYLQAYATDLDGNVIWGYDYADRDANSIIQPIQPLPNGNMAMVISYASQFEFTPDKKSKVNVVREINLAGETVRDLTIGDLNQRMAAAGHPLQLLDFHHELTVLPNGHWLTLASVFKQFTDLPGTTGPTNVLGDVVIDLDQNWNPVWVWNTFDHLDVNRRPLDFPDWTHSNAILYLPGDGNLLVSMRHQNWIVKVNYSNGAGNGDVIWRLGNEGDFQLVNGNAPQDWSYAQHDPQLQGDSSVGVFRISVMDNGNDRAFPDGVQCDAAGQPACLYSTVPIYEIDETAKTATLVFHQITPPSQYSSYGGSTTRLANGNVEYDLCNEPNLSGLVQEVTTEAQPQMVWQMFVSNQNLYRARRIPSLYPGVQW